jgi:hypothetical protein
MIDWLFAQCLNLRRRLLIVNNSTCEKTSVTEARRLVHDYQCFGVSPANLMVEALRKIKMLRAM